MISPFVRQNRFRVLIPIRILSFSSSASSLLFLLLILAPSLFFSPTLSEKPDPDPNPEAMRVHPLPRKRNATTTPCARDLTREPVKKLRRLPHIFSRVLELPFKSDVDVAVEEKPDCFKFVAETDGVDEVRAYTVEIHPGITKIVVRTDGWSMGSLDELELDVWRFRLPDSTRPDLVTAVYEGDKLVVTVPKAAEEENEEEGEKGGDGGFRGDIETTGLFLYSDGSQRDGLKG